MIDQIIAQSNIEARNYQRRIVNKTVQSFHDDYGTVLVESPTGSGKTIMGLLSAKMLQEKHNIGIGWVAMRRTLLSQVARENNKSGISVDSLQPISMFDKNPPLYDKQGRRIGLLVVDEAQHDAATSMAAIHNKLEPQFVLGLTATPFRTDRLKLAFSRVIKDIGIHQLIQKGFLSEYHLYSIQEWTPECVTGTYLREPERWGKSVMFWHKVEDAELCVQLLRLGGQRAELMLGTMPMSQREEMIAKFEADEIDVIVNLFLLTEGFDCPSLQTVWIRDSQKGPTIQMGGRVFRKYPGISHKNIVQSKLTHWPMIKTALPAEQYSWLPEEQEWRSYKPNPQITKVAIQATLINARTEVQLPNLIKKHQQRRNGRWGGWGNRS